MRCFGFSPLRLPADLDFSACSTGGRAGAAGLAAVRRPGAGRLPGPVLTLEDLPNLGPASAGWLREVGITSYEDLERLGSVAAYQLVADRRPGVSRNLLYALEGALQDVRWDLLSPELRAELRRRAGR
jgi:DNA transformation protein